MSRVVTRVTLHFRETASCAIGIELTIHNKDKFNGRLAVVRRQRKEEAKHLKRKRIQEAGGVRPHPHFTPEPVHAQTKMSGPENGARKPSHSSSEGKHRFGRVMERVPC